MSFIKKTATFLFCTVFLLFAVINVNSQTSVKPVSENPPTTPVRKPSLGVAPAIVIANVKPGKTFTQEFTLANGSDGYVRFRCSLGDYWFDKDNAPVLASAGTLERSASPWIQFTPSEVLIAPQSSVVVKAVISIPQNAVGGYYSMPFFEGEAAEPPNSVASKGEIRAVSSIALRIGGLIMLSTEKDSDYNIEIVNGKATPPTDSTELELTLDVINRGNVHAYLKGLFAILDDKGQLVGQGKIEDRMAMPSQSRTLKGIWSGDLPPGDYTVLSTISFERAGLAPMSLVNEVPLKVVKR
ncbi:MAG: hypothetical protein H7Z37_07190 [Pyrinomonadaceae bacterium]|nr:hypothetical protein [Pyrinomonadaceae bacterium]